MSIATAITAAQGKVANAYTAVSNKGGTLPATQNLSNLPTAINSIPSGGSSPVISSLSITPSTSAQTFNANNVDGYKPVTVSAVTSSIDSNITAGNIKSGVSILGVTGNYTGTTPSGTLSITANGVYDVTNYASADVSVSGGTSDWVTSTNFTISMNRSYFQLENIVASVGYRIVGEDSDGNVKVVGCLYDADGNVIIKSNEHYLGLNYEMSEYVEGYSVILCFSDTQEGDFRSTLISIDLS